MILRILVTASKLFLFLKGKIMKHLPEKIWLPSRATT